MLTPTTQEIKKRAMSSCPGRKRKKIIERKNKRKRQCAQHINKNKGKKERKELDMGIFVH